ncbi:MAG TPA: NAD(P)-dependent oxidoreductase [Candidatus Paceibacterota bacterium]|nr:NAD(P)-dependent oxidoreductase [Verrucomicrobiota bacterium]HRZ45491.1 NAD(P)-dependent oxidoreductase [Candidatus Paceibacterota bacterium]HRZ92583.1 NAD(P)-dependent oxidoreductase [Candidatus Paceibacterota bacterium]
MTATARTVLVTEPEYRKAEAVFREARDVRCEPAPSEESALTARVDDLGVRAVIVGVACYRGPLYEALGKRGDGLIARFGVGHDNIDKPLARQHGVVVANTPGALDQSVAEHTLWLMGCLARRIARLDARVRAGEFAGQAGIELGGKTLCVLGLGSIGRRVAAMACFGFGMEVVACGRRATAERIAECGIARYTDCAEDALRQCDVLSVHLRSDASTRHFIDASKLRWLKPGALLINTARGAVLDEAALFDALAGGRLAGAALDVFEREPYQPAHPDKDLRTLDSALLTPHAGSNTHEANARMARAAIDNARHFLAGQLERMTRVEP